jgi:hypothetical protein
MAKWEYFVESAGTQSDDIEGACRRSGEDGWELVSAIVVEATTGEFRTRLIFKRPLEG